MTRIVAFFVGDHYKPSFATVTGRGPHPKYSDYQTWNAIPELVEKLTHIFYLVLPGSPRGYMQNIHYLYSEI